jgi:hypothetical protein
LRGIAGELAAIGITQADADAVVVHAEGVEHDLHEREAAEDFGGDLFLGAEEMGIVLREAAHAGHAVELTALLPAIHRAELGEAHRQIAVAVRLAVEDLDVVRAVHRLQQEAVEKLLVGQHAIFGDDLLAGALIELLSAVSAETAPRRSMTSQQPQPSLMTLARSSFSMTGANWLSL